MFDSGSDSETRSTFDTRRVVTVGHPKIDTEHRKIFQWLDTLEQAFLRGEGHTQIGTMLDNLSGYVDTHFREEEALMRQLHMPNLAEHQRQHQRLRKHLNQLVADYHNDQPVLSFELVHLLQVWLTEHINQMDAQIGHYLRR